MKRIILFASGSGSNAEQIMQYAKQKNVYTVSAVFTNNANAGVIEKAKNYQIPTIVFNREERNNGSVV